MKRLVFLLFVLAAAPIARAQDVKTDPLQCWWRTSEPAVRVGQPFSVVLTCAVLETDAATVVIDQSKLEPSVVQFAPFEVLGGSHGADLHTDLRRFFQYEYRVRLIAENQFGRDVPLPELKLSYRVQSKVGQNAAIQGRDQSYVLPPHSVRVVSLVPADAADIRDSGSETFADIDQRGFRASLFIVIGGVLFALAALLTLLALVRLIARYRQPAASTDRLVADGAILGAARGELARVRREREGGGWTPDLVRRAANALRIVASYAVGRRVAQTAVDGAPSANGNAAADGILVVRRGWPKTRRVAVSGSATPRAVATEIARGPKTAKRAAMLESLGDALDSVTTAQYGNNGAGDEAALDRGVEAGVSAAGALRMEQLTKRFRRRRPARAVESRVWSR